MLLRRTARLCGSYVLNQRVVPDWWHPYHRQDALESAKALLSSAVRADEQAAEDGGRRRDSSADVDDAGDAHIGAPTATPSLTLREVNALVATFASNGDVDELSAALQYLREHLQLPLAPFHYNALFRVFNHSRDTANALQLMEVMAQRGEMTVETYARAVDCIHCLAPVDALARALAVVEAAQEAFGSLVQVDGDGDGGGTEAAVVADLGNIAGGRLAALEVDEADDDDAAAAAAASSSGPSPSSSSGGGCASAPVLTALLHHVAMAADPEAALVVALWVCAVGAPLSDWDLVHVASSLLVRTEAFPRLRALYGAFAGFETGTVSPAAVLRRLRERGEADPAAATTAVAAAMERSLLAAGVDVERPVAVHFMNTRTTSLLALIEQAISRHSPGGAAAAPFPADGLGAHRYNPALLRHSLLILHSSLRCNAEAARTFLRAAAIAEEQRQQRQGEGEGMGPGGTGGVGDAPHAEPFRVGPHFLMDMGQLLPTLSASARGELRGPFTRLVQQLTMEEREARLQGTLGVVVGGGDTETAAAAVAECAALPPLRPSAADLLGLETYALGFLRSPAEAAAALQQTIARVDRSRARLPRETRLAFKQLAQYCCDHPLRSPKLTAVGLSERRKWGQYLDARDAALSLFGSSKTARDAMKHIYYHGNTLPALRSQAVIERDMADVLQKLFRTAPAAGGQGSEESQEEEEEERVRALVGSVTAALMQHRTTQPHVRSAAADVPAYLYDPAVDNPYPHVALRRAPAAPEAEADAGSGDSDVDVFAELWRALMDPAVMGADTWYIRNTDMYLLLMRCLLHRLDWEAAAHLTAKMLENTTYTYLMDHELTTIFREIGDPAGCLAFKVATKLFDGRITRDGQTKRERFHQGQFE